MKKKLTWITELALFFAVSFPLSLLPLALARKAGRGLGLGYYHWNKKRRRIAVENVNRAIGKGALPTGLSPEEIVKESDKNMGCSLLELVKIYYGRGGGVFRSISIEGFENFEKAKARGKGVMFITGHCGNWELLGLTLSEKTRTGVVGRPLNNPYLNTILERLREKYGNYAIHKKGALRGLLRAFKEGGNIAILMDQAVIPDEGVVINFLGSPAWTIKTPATMAKRTSAALLPAFIKRQGSGHRVIIHPEVQPTGDEREDIQRLTNYIEDYVRGNPTEWLWIHRRWKRTEGM
ncbi:MAG: lysophospholipid acyltransferase family protein [Thermodesulfovibrionales bacterium]|nr:lysophospholipid acyltransferase family protein [Thermodesulfovibrionales bacterium]